ncbi:thymidylate kinase-domain-containing protein [Mucidula mucida]|nr:thymidylate kinase-domain-containing protein [Mucidula mucida]
MARRGAFIVIEGLDRSGKTSQTTHLKERLKKQGKKVELLKFPERTTIIGGMINAYLQSETELDDHVIHLLFSANRWELASTLISQLNDGTTIICDRYAFSGIAFSAAKGLPLSWCRAPDVGLPRPDLVVFLDISAEAARARGGYGSERYEKEEMQEKVRRVFEALREEGDKDGEMEVNWVAVNAGRDKEAVSDDMWRHVERLVDGIERPVGKLWSS